MTLNDQDGVGKIGDFQPISRRVSETVPDRAKISTIDHYYEVLYMPRSIGPKINDFARP